MEHGASAGAAVDRWAVVNADQLAGQDAGGGVASIGGSGLDDWQSLASRGAMQGTLPVELLRDLQAAAAQQPADRAISPNSFARMFGSRLSLQEMVIQEGDESAEQGSDDVQALVQRVRSGEDVSSAAGSSLPNVPSSERLLEMARRRSGDGAQDMYAGLAGVDAAGTSQQPIMPPMPTGQAQAGPSGADAMPGDIPTGDLSRTLFVRNIDSGVLDEELYNLFEVYGEIRTLYTACKHRGFVVISFYDLRAACLAVHMLNNTPLKGRALDITFSTQDADKESLQGRVLVYLTDPSLTPEELYRVFTGFGDVKAIEDVAGKPGHRMVEYYDVRHAATALKSLNRADVAKKLLVFEPAAMAGGGAGGLAAGLDVQAAAAAQQQRAHAQQQQQQHAQAAALGHAMSSDALAGSSGQLLGQAQARGMLRNLSEGSLAQLGGGGGGGGPLGGSMHDLQALQQTLQMTGGLGLQRGAQEQLLNSASQAQLLSQHGSRASLVNSMSHGNLAGGLQQLQGGAGGGDGASTGPGGLYGSAAMLAASASDPRLVNEALLQQQAAAGAGAAGMLQQRGGSAAGLAGLPMSMSAGDLSALASSGRLGAHGGAGSVGGGGLRGIASTGNLWSAAQQVLAAQGAGAPPPSWSGSMPNLAAAVQQPGALPSWQQLQEAAALQNQQALQGLGLAGLSQSASVDNLLAGLAQGGPGGLLGAPSLSAAQQLLQQAVSLQAVQQGGGGPYGALGGAGRGMPKSGLPRGHKDRRDDGGLGGPGGRLSRRNLDPVAEAERKAQQEKLYALDIDRIMSGQDKRTTLMIKNIPNKYTQKMLLTTIDEKFKGTYDFFYLPIDFKNKCNVGYAFINLILPEYIVPLVERFNNKKWEKFNSEKICNISYARIQGKAALVAHFQNSSLLHEDKRCRPILFHSEGPYAGDQEPFPMKASGARLTRSGSRGSMGSLPGASRGGW